MMPIGERFRGGGTRGIARFLADHQHCDAGFDVRRDDPHSSGKLRITCEGCGESIAYNASQAVEFAAAAVIPEPVGNGDTHIGAAADSHDDSGTRAQPPPDADLASSDREAGPGDIAPEPADEGTREALNSSEPSQEPSLGPRRRVPSWIPIALIAALIGAGLGMIGFGLLRSGDEGASGTEQGTTQADQGQGENPPAGAGPNQAAPAPANPSLAARALSRRKFEGFSIGVPAGWDASATSAGATLKPPGDSAEVSVFVGRSERSPLEFARLSIGFLAGRHPGARLGEPRPARFQGERAATVSVRFDGGRETATFLSAGGVAFVLIRRVDDDASARSGRRSAASLQSFRSA